MKNFKYSYRSKLFILVTALTWLIVAVFVWFSLTRDQQYRTDLLNSKLQSMNEFMLKGHDSGKTWTELDLIYPELRVTVTDCNGKVIYDSNESIIGENFGDRSEVSHAIKHGTGYTIRRASKGDEKDYFYSATKCNDIIIRSALPYDASLYTKLSIDYSYIGILLAIGIIVNIIAWMFLSRATQSIRTLRDFAVNAENNPNFNPNDYYFPNDELGDISDEIVSLYNKQKRSNKEAADNLNQLLNEEQEKARIKQQLSSNISHELKTPIHAINACLETIKDNYDSLPQETIKDLIEKGMEQSQRLVALVNDLSLITRLSDGHHHISTSKVDLTNVIKNVAKEVELLPKEKQMRINLSLPDKLIVEGNSDLLESIFRNLQTNAIEYSGGRDITIEYLATVDNKIKLRFADNGIGVSSEHLSKIFERFYRPDEGRNRKHGGTGLGLSIVKNSIIFHGGEIKANNLETGGLEFVFTIAIDNNKK